VTGLLIQSEHGFVQTIEGLAGAVETVYRRVIADSRHADMYVFSDETIRKCVYSDWTMLSEFQMTSRSLRYLLGCVIEARDSKLTAGQFNAIKTMIESMKDN
jgi:Sensors of blue-light using FAD